MCTFLVPCQRRTGIESTSTVHNAAEQSNKLITTINSTMFCTLVRHTALLVPKHMSTVWVWAHECLLIISLP